MKGPKAQCVTSPDADPRVVNLIQTQAHTCTFMEIDCEIFSTVIPLLPLNQEGMLSVTSESMCTEYWLIT